MPIRIDKSSDLRIIITALEVVEPRFRIEIVTAVEKGIEGAGGCARIGVSLGGKQIAPCVIEIGNAQIAVRIVHGNHISLRVAIVIDGTAAGTRDHLQHGRTAGGVIEIPQVALERIAFKDLLPVDLSALALVFVPGVAHCLLRADPVRVIAVRGQRSVFGIRLQPPPRKGERSPPVGGGIANGVKSNASVLFILVYKVHDKKPNGFKPYEIHIYTK